ncbi:hypothetical protein ACS0TY_017187 [Phlomoides rotata]
MHKCSRNTRRKLSFSCVHVRKGNHNAKRTPRGLIFRQRWNNRQFITNASFITTVYSDYLTFVGKSLNCAFNNVSPAELLSFAKSQLSAYDQSMGKNVGHHSTTSLSNSESLDYNSRKGHVRQLFSYDVDACYYGLAMTSLALDVTLLPCLLGITAIFLRENPTKKWEIKDNSKKSDRDSREDADKAEGAVNNSVERAEDTGRPSGEGETLARGVKL